MNKKELEDKVTKFLSEWFNDNAPLGEEAYRTPAKNLIGIIRRAINQEQQERGEG